MKWLSFKKKLWMPLVISVLGMLSIGLFNAYHEREVRIDERRIDVIHAVEIALGVVKKYAAYAEAGTLSAEDAKKQALEVLKTLRYGKDGFFVVDNFNAHVVMHSDAPKFDGRDMSAFTDIQGRHVHVMISAMARESGKGFVYYVSPHFLGGVPAQKMSYVMAYEPWRWAIFTGAYIDDINDAVWDSLVVPTIVLTAVIAALSCFIAFAARGIQHQLGGDPEYASAVAAHIATGDLSQPIASAHGDVHSLIGHMKMMRDSLVLTIHGIVRSADSVALAASEINSGNLDLSHRTELQANSLGETAASMEQITGMVRNTADGMRRVMDLAGDATRVTDQGGAIVSQAVDAMRNMSNQSQKMVEIIAVIEAIAFQTNILALNAAVEAARAGDQGRGFAVVAAEVRTLAQRSAIAAKEIRTLIRNSVEQVDASSTLIELAGTTMKEAQGALSLVSVIISEIEAASQQQSEGIKQISDAVAQMDDATQQNAALVEQSAAAAHSLEQLATHLRAEMAVFTLSETGVEVVTANEFGIKSLRAS